MNEPHLPNRDEVRTAYQQGEEAVVELVDGLIKIIGSLAARVQALEDQLAQKADEVVILEKPDDYYAVSQAYLSFYNLSDEDALKFMQRREKEKGVIKEVS